MKRPYETIAQDQIEKFQMNNISQFLAIANVFCVDGESLLKKLRQREVTEFLEGRNTPAEQEAGRQG